MTTHWRHRPARQHWLARPGRGRRQLAAPSLPGRATLLS